MPTPPPKLEYEPHDPIEREPANWWVLIVMLCSVPLVVLLSYFFKFYGAVAAVFVIVSFLYIKSRRSN